MGGVMGPQAWGLLVLGVLLACGQLIDGAEYYGDYGEGYTIRCTIGIQIITQPPGGQFDVCAMLRAGLPPNIIGPKCRVIGGNDQDYYTLYDLAFELQPDGSAYRSRQYLLGVFDVAAAESAVYGGKYVPGTLEFFDIDECVDKSNQCSPNAACYNDWATYTCECLDGYKDYSEANSRRGYICDREDVKPSDRPELDIQIWVYVLIAIAIFVVLMLLVCCCCCYSGSSDCCPSMHQARTKVIKHIKIVPQPMPVQGPPPCICKPPEEKKIIIQVDQAPQAAPAQQVMQYEPMVSGPSAFIANSGYDGKVYIAGHQAQPVKATRPLPWADGSSLQTVNPTVQYIQQEPQQVQYIQQPQSIQYQQPIYDQPTPYVYTLDTDTSAYYQ